MREVIDQSRMNMKMVEAHVADIPDEQMCARPPGAPAHPAWQLGHLTWVRHSLLQATRQPSEFPPEWAEIFARGTQPSDQTGRYPRKDQLLHMLKTLNEKVLLAIPSISQDALDGPHPIAGLRPFAPTFRGLLTLLLTSHDGYHVGQIAAWRGAMKLKSIL